VVQINNKLHILLISFGWPKTVTDISCGKMPSLFKNKPVDARKIGRPRLKRLEDVDDDLRELKVKK
jgi:hypothetical protein